MIIDTTYLLPIARVGIDTDLLLAVAEGRTDLQLSEISVNLVSLFELQAKAAKLRIPTQTVSDSIHLILDTFRVVPLSDEGVLDFSFRLRQKMNDYIDCIIVGTAAARHEDLVTGDSKIWNAREVIREEYGITVHRYKDMVKPPHRSASTISLHHR